MATHCGIWTHDGCIPGGGGGRLRKAGLFTTDHGMQRRVEDTTVESTGITSDFAGSGFCSAGMLSSAAVRSGIAAPVVSSRAASQLYSRVTTKHESVLDRANSAAHCRPVAKGRLLRKVISSNECTGALRIDESGAPSARIPGQGFKVAPTLGPPTSKGLLQKTPNLAQVQEPYSSRHILATRVYRALLAQGRLF